MLLRLTTTIVSITTTGRKGLRRRQKGKTNVRFGSKADICSAKRHVRFTPGSDRESGLPLTVMSALPPYADMCGATRDVRYGPIADIDAITGSRRQRGRALMVAR